MISSDSKLTINVFGKAGCQKCAMLNRRIDKLLTEPKYSVFSKSYSDVLTEDGLVKFCKAECLNPSRIPAMVISCGGTETDPTYIANPQPDAEDSVCRHSRLYTYLGIQTDYSDEGKGVITPEMIQKILDEALEIA